MTVTNSSNKVIYQGDGATSSFTFPFIGVSASDIEVIYTDANGNQTTLLSNQYSVTLNSPIAGAVWGIGGFVAYTNIAIGTTLTIVRILPLTQNSSFSNQGPLYPSAIEQAIDVLAMEIQQISEMVGRILLVNITDPPILSLPPAAQRAGEILGFDSNGNPLLYSPNIALLPNINNNNTWTGSNTFNGPVYFKDGYPWVDVRAFGAVGSWSLSNNVSDYAAILAAINFIYTLITPDNKLFIEAAILYFPPGVYSTLNQTAILSGAYNSSTGVVTLQVTSSPGLGVGDRFHISGVNGTGAYANVNGNFSAITGTGGTQIVLQLASGSSLTIANNTGTLSNGLNINTISGTGGGSISIKIRGAGISATTLIANPIVDVTPLSVISGFSDVEDLQIVGMGTPGWGSVSTTPFIQPTNPALYVGIQVANSWYKRLLINGGNGVEAHCGDTVFYQVFATDSYGAAVFNNYGDNWLDRCKLDQQPAGIIPYGDTPWSSSGSDTHGNYSLGDVVVVTSGAYDYTIVCTNAGATGSVAPAPTAFYLINYPDPSGSGLTWQLAGQSGICALILQGSGTQNTILATDFTGTFAHSVLINGSSSSFVNQTLMSQCSFAAYGLTHIYAISGFGLAIGNCNFQGGSTPGGNFILLDLNWLGGVTISNNTFFAVTNTLNGVYINAGTGTTIVGNVFSALTNAAVLVGSGVKSFTVVGNSFGVTSTFAACEAGVVVTTGSSDHYTISGNIYNGCTVTVADGGTGTHKFVEVEGVLLSFTLGLYTIATLPAAPARGTKAYVTNGVASPTYLGVVSTTGSTMCPVFFNGTNWVYG